MNSLNRREKLAQLFMVPTWSGTDLYNKPLIDSLIINYKIGGLIFFQGGPLRQVNLYNAYQSISKTPLLIGFDGEWGLSMRLDSTIRFPRQMTLGAMPDPKLIYDMGFEIARQCKLVGIHVNFAPDIDINNNPNNPVINSRSFGENKFEVTRRGMEYMKGMQDNRVLACGKHFPGHGNTDTDSHFTLPLINQTADELDSVELFPFRKLIDEGMGSIMVAHLNVPALDTTANLPSTLSRPMVTDLLKNKMDFHGLIFTDALDMKGVAVFYKPGELEMLTLKAGCDVLLNSVNIPVALDSIDHAIENGFLDSNAVYQSVEKILQLKYWCGLNKPQVLDTTDLYNRLNKNEDAQWLNYQLYRNSITLLKNENKTLPLKSFNEKSIASLVINDSLNNTFQQTISRYAFIDLFKMNKEVPPIEFESLMSELVKYKTVIISIHNTSTKVASNFGISEQMNKAIAQLKSKTKLIVVVFGNSYTLTKLTEAKQGKALLLSYEDTYLPALVTAQVLFGAIQPHGTIPVAPDSSYIAGEGLGKLDSINVLKYSNPLEYNVDSKKLAMIDSIVNNAIAQQATPGCQVLVAYKGSVIYQKSFGTYTYTDSTKVENDKLYDIASVTKIASTALAAMMLYDKGDIDINKKLGKYLPDLKKSNKKDLLLRDMLTHQAGLLPWIPFYKETLTDTSSFKPDIYNNLQSLEFPYKVADSLFINKDYPNKIWKEIIQSELKDSGKYVYSDFGPIIMQHIIERITDESIDSVVFKNFYKPLGIQRITYLPLSKFIKGDIVPTEYDSVFRKQLIQGYVHDPAAAMFGGVSGNAGVFSNAQSLAVIMQMLLQKGNYGKHQYIKKETVELFTRQFYKYTANRRGLLFDKPEPDKTKNGPTAIASSANTFGHQGFTGTCAWVDPDKELVYIFLSNRVNPSAANNKLAQMNVRTEIMEAIYKALPVK
ncbi:MAG: glycoside hydrolase family 3 N-terminal domain-containing protein [Bacteroidia bacterium]